MDQQQRVWDSPGSKSRDMAHDVAIYRAARLEQARFEERGATLRRVRTDAELKGEINRRSEAARGGGGREAADRARLKAAEELHLPVQDGKVQIPTRSWNIWNPTASPEATSTSKSSPATTGPPTLRPRPPPGSRCMATGVRAPSR